MRLFRTKRVSQLGLTSRVHLDRMYASGISAGVNSTGARSMTCYQRYTYQFGDSGLMSKEKVSTKGARNFWLSLPERKDRDQNELNDIDELWIASTHSNHPMNQSSPTLFKTAFGNINGDGVPTSFSSPILGMRNSMLEAALEPRIAPLVGVIKNVGLVSYSSCEGHFIDGEAYEAYAGILFDDNVTGIAEKLADYARKSGFDVYRSWLSDSTNGKRHRTVEIYLPLKGAPTVDRYHERLDKATNALANAVSVERKSDFDLQADLGE